MHTAPSLPMAGMVPSVEDTDRQIGRLQRHESIRPEDSIAVLEDYREAAVGAVGRGKGRAAFLQAEREAAT